MDSLNIKTLKANRKNTYTFTLTDSGQPYDLTGKVVHFSILSGDEEIVHKEVTQHIDATAGKTIVEIGEGETSGIVSGVYYEWELSLINNSEEAEGLVKGQVKATNYHGSTT